MKVHSVESLAALDGEGIRYALFLGGCPLRCVCCHNPDTWFVDACEDKTPEQLFSKIRRYKPYFGQKGGVTFSGGEPLLQAGEIVELATLLSQDGIGYTLDTSGCVSLTQSVKTAVNGAELVILDFKYATSSDYKKYTDGEISQVLDFLKYLVCAKKRIWLRTVIIPGINDSEEYIDRLLETIAPYVEHIEKYELLAFHTMGFFKYDKLGIKNPLDGTPPLSAQHLSHLQQYLNLKKEKHR